MTDVSAAKPIRRRLVEPPPVAVNRCANRCADWAKRIGAVMVKSAVEIGRQIAAARDDLDGEFEMMVVDYLHMDPSTAQRLMKIARDARLSDPAHVQLLPSSWGTLYELTKLDDATFNTALERGTIHPAMERKDAAPLLEAARAAKREASAPRTPQLMYALATWPKLTATKRGKIIAAGRIADDKGFNPQTGDEIAWARWSWNPITGCLHPCEVYCYAREIAGRSPAYPQKFVPYFHPARLSAPFHTRVPERAATDIAFRNVFVGSMGDLFGRWVPADVIQAVLDTVILNPQWTFLLLSKFPRRYLEFAFPDNCWLGATVDFQIRMKATELAFAKLRDRGVDNKLFISFEPFLDPEIRPTRLDLCNWIIIGGASRTDRTPEWRPPFHWWAPLHLQALELGLEVFHKTNLYERTERWPGDGLTEITKCPEVFEYLKHLAKEDIEQGEA